MKYMYKLRADIIYDEDNRPYTVYGADCIVNNKIVASEEDIFFDIDKANKFIDLCNAVNLHPDYLPDMAENAIEEEYCTAN